MSNILNIMIRKEERATLRILNIIERRGFDVVSLNLPYATTDTQMMTVRVKNRYKNFSTDVLTRQLNQMHIVIHAEARSADAKSTEMMVPPATLSALEACQQPNYVDVVR